MRDTQKHIGQRPRATYANQLHVNSSYGCANQLHAPCAGGHAAGSHHPRCCACCMLQTTQTHNRTQAGTHTRHGSTLLPRPSHPCNNGRQRQSADVAEPAMHNTSHKRYAHAMLPTAPPSLILRPGATAPKQHKSRAAASKPRPALPFSSTPANNRTEAQSRLDELR